MAFSVLIVCTGNTCRSAMAEGILKRMLAETGSRDVSVSSVGVGTAPGWPASKEAIQACGELEVDITGHRSNIITLELIRQADWILCMEKHHAACVLDIDPKARDRVYLLGEFDARTAQKEIPDPVGLDLPIFRQCADRIFSALQGFMKELPELKKEREMQRKKPSRIAIGADHRGYPLKQKLIEFLRKEQYEVADCGTDSTESTDHPDQALAVAELVKDGKVDRGILICSNGIGMCMVANKVPGVYAALVGDEHNAKQCREHNGANVLCLGEKPSGEEAAKITDIFLNSFPLDGEKYERRREKVRQYEAKYMK